MIIIIILLLVVVVAFKMFNINHQDSGSKSENNSRGHEQNFHNSVNTNDLNIDASHNHHTHHHDTHSHHMNHHDTHNF